MSEETQEFKHTISSALKGRVVEQAVYNDDGNLEIHCEGGFEITLGYNDHKDEIVMMGNPRVVVNLEGSESESEQGEFA